MATFGKVNIKDDNQWETWSWKDFLSFYDNSLKGQVTESPEEIAKVLGVKIPVQKPKQETV
jgi:hypothetical protein